MAPPTTLLIDPAPLPGRAPPTTTTQAPPLSRCFLFTKYLIVALLVSFALYLIAIVAWPSLRADTLEGLKKTSSSGITEPTLYITVGVALCLTLAAIPPVLLHHLQAVGVFAGILLVLGGYVNARDPLLLLFTLGNALLMAAYLWMLFKHQLACEDAADAEAQRMEEEAVALREQQQAATPSTRTNNSPAPPTTTTTTTETTRTASSTGVASRGSAATATNP
jgi:hypothetical protein